MDSMYPINRNNRRFTKKIIFGILLLFLLTILYGLNRDSIFIFKANKDYELVTPFKSQELLRENISLAFKGSMKHILQWETTETPLNLMGEGRSKFIEYNCEFSNCYVTSSKTFLPKLSQFDAIAFSGNNLHPNGNKSPYPRSEKQKYIFAAAESAHNYGVCDGFYDNFFNWTWTYRLDSDVRWGYVKIYDLEGRPVGPKINMSWPKLDSIPDKLKTSLGSKQKVAAWFISNCNSMSKREQFVSKLQRELAIKNYTWTVDVYGKCGKLKCERDHQEECFEMLRRDYFFYFSFENSFSEDYVTEKLVTALNNDAVPVVYGAADYSRFLPPGSYLNARELGVVKLAETMDAIYRNRTAYYEFFRWKNHFRYEHTINSDICNLCAALNDEEAMRTPTVYKDFRKWWNGDQWDGGNC